MINDSAIAKEISDLMLKYGARLDASVAQVQKRASAQEFEAYRAAIGKILGAMLLEVMNPLYARHPHLKPDRLI